MGYLQDYNQQNGSKTSNITPSVGGFLQQYESQKKPEVKKVTKTVTVTPPKKSVLVIPKKTSTPLQTIKQTTSNVVKNITDKIKFTFTAPKIMSPLPAEKPIMEQILKIKPGATKIPIKQLNLDNKQTFSAQVTPQAGLTPTSKVVSKISSSLSKEFPETANTINNLIKDPLSLKANPNKIIGDVITAFKQPLQTAIQRNINSLQPSKSISESIGKELLKITGTAGVILSPIGAIFSAADNIPVIASFSKLITLPYLTLGEGAPKVSNKIIDSLPIPQKTKDNLKPAIAETLTLASQLALGRFMEVTGKKIKTTIKYTGIDVFEKITKNIIEETNSPRTISLTADQVRDINNRGLGATDAKDFFKTMGVEDRVKALKTGMTVEFPTEKIIRVVDKPYWEKIKSYFKQEPTDRIISKTSTTKPIVSNSFGGYLTPGEYTPQEVIGKVMKAGEETTPAGKEAIKAATEAQKTGQNIIVEQTKPIPEKVSQGEGKSINVAGIEEATKYTSSKDFADAIYSAKPTDQIGELPSDQITARDTTDKVGVQEYVDKIKTGEVVDPVEVIKINGKFITTDGSHRVTAYKLLNRPVPVIYRGADKIAGLKSFDEVYKEANPPAPKPIEVPEQKPVESIIKKETTKLTKAEEYVRSKKIKFREQIQNEKEIIFPEDFSFSSKGAEKYYYGNKTQKLLQSRPTGDLIIPKDSFVSRGFTGERKGHWFTPDRGEAEGYAMKEGGKVQTLDISGKKLANFNKYGNGGNITALEPNELADIVNKALKEGYDGLYSSEMGTVLLPNKEQLKTKELFRIKDDFKKATGITITDKQEAEIIKLNKEIFGDENIKITEQILANSKVLGVYNDRMIKIVGGQADAKDTFYHEAVHKYLDVVLTEQEHIEMLMEAQKIYGIDDFAKVEEKLAEDFIKYVKNKEGFIGKLKLFFEKILLRIQKFLNNKKRINELYNDILSGQKKKGPPKTPEEVKTIMKKYGELIKEGTKQMEEQIVRNEKIRADIEGLSPAILKDISILKRMARATTEKGGDIEDLYKKNSELTSRVLEAIREQKKDYELDTGMTDEQALEIAINLPTKLEIRSATNDSIKEAKKLLRESGIKLNENYEDIGNIDYTKFEEEFNQANTQLLKEAGTLKIDKVEFSKIFKDLEILKAVEERGIAQNPVGEGKLKKSKAYTRVKDRIAEEAQLDVNYNILNLEQDTQNAMNFIIESPKKAIRVALGLESPPKGQTETAISIALADKAGREENFLLESQLEASRSLRQTRRGQEIVSERGRFSENSPHYFIKRLMDTRLTNLGRNLKGALAEGKTLKKIAIEKIDKGVTKLKQKLQVDRKKIQLAQDIIDSLRC